MLKDGQAIEKTMEDILYLQVCTNVDDKDLIERYVQTKWPSGTSGNWRLMGDEEMKDFPDGKNTNPVDCAEKQGFKHWLFIC